MATSGAGVDVYFGAGVEETPTSAPSSTLAPYSYRVEEGARVDVFYSGTLFYPILIRYLSRKQTLCLLRHPIAIAL